ncbi:MAG: hypothetical protein CMD26_05520 [Flavobacteriales bacterium]|nr:hypothetical protein [Flavobacteriales bacterium]
MASFNVYKASAGSGKTYTLVKEYIKTGLLNKGKITHKSLLAITFTNKAASEMKNRIVTTLFQFSKGHKKIDSSFQSIYKDLKIELNFSDEELCLKSKKFLSDIIHYYGYFSVSTIDKFIHKIIRGFTYELNLPSNFEVEMDNKKIIQEGVYSLFDDLGRDATVTQNLINYSIYKTHENKNWDIEEDLLKLSDQLFKDHKSFIIQNLSDAKTIFKKQKEIHTIIDRFEKRVDVIKDQLNPLVKDIPDHVFPYQDLPRYLKKLRKKPYLGIQFSKRLYQSYNNKKWYKKSEDITYKQQVDSISKSLEDLLSQLLLLIDSDYSKYLFYRSCYRSFFLVSLLSRIDQKIGVLKKNNNIIHISEFNQIISNFLQKSPAPFIYEKIGNRYNHYFIDEFQDTSKTQWHNLIPLLEEALSTGGTCLIVGDGKQSIYRWRGGEVEQFLALSSSTNKTFLNHFKVDIKSLDTNYRSGDKIVNFNNTFFSFLSQHLSEPYNKLYKNLDQKHHRSETGYVEVEVLDSKGLVLENQTLEKTYKNIMDAKKDNYSFSDIVVLTRSNKDITKVATYLTEKGIPIISSESLLLKKSILVQFLINNLIVLNDESNFLSKAKLLTSLASENKIKLEFSHEIISKYSTSNNIDFSKFLNSIGINWNLKKLKKLSIYELIEELIRVFKINQANNLYIRFFLDFVYDFSIKESNSIIRFLNFWDQKRDTLSIIIPQGIDAVELMSVHKSKGLQFPIVIMPFVNWKEDLGKEKDWFDVAPFLNNKENNSNFFTLLPLNKELEKWPPPFPRNYLNHKNKVLLDNINILYVAMTRAKDRLYVISNSDTRKGNIFQYFLSFFKTLQTPQFGNNIFKDGQKRKLKACNNRITHIKYKDYDSSEWRERLRIRKKRGFNKSLKQRFSIVWGDLIHEIMASINKIEDLEPALKKMNIKYKYGLRTYNRIKMEISSIINDSKIKHLFNSELNTFLETSIITSDGSIYRPDRVVEHSKTVASLIDYKTGLKNKSHIHQLNKYESILLQLGYGKINKYLVYLSLGEIIEL